MADILSIVVAGASALLLGFVMIRLLWWLGEKVWGRLFLVVLIVLMAASGYAEDKNTKARTIEELALVGAHAFDAATTEIWLARDPWIDAEGRQWFPSDRNALYRALDSPAERIAVRAAGVAFTLWLARKVENRWGPTPARIMRYTHIGAMTGLGAFNVSVIVRY